MKRRNALLGLGALATGSGAISTTASIVNSIETTSELGIVVRPRVEVRAGKAFNDDGSVKSRYQSHYLPYDSNSSFFDDTSDTLDNIDKSELPVATVNRRDQYVNENVKLQVAFDLRRDSDTFRFENILEVENYGGESQKIGIAYDRTDTTYDPNGQYGEQVTLGGSVDNSDLTGHDVRWVYSFIVPDRFTDTGPTKISPAYNDSDSDDGMDDPNRYFSLGPGETVQLDLKINLGNYLRILSNPIDPRKGIESQIDKTPSFAGTTDLVEMLDAITIQTDEAEN
ncbi:hypothetical protein [Halonotius aquaticus]|nr:hypothetical protein [Halonotius aquaticus]